MPNLRTKMDSDNTSFSVQVIQGAATALDMKSSRERKAAVQDWQSLAYEYYDTIPEVFYGANFTGNCLARIRLVAAEASEVLSEAPRETSNKAIVEAVKNFSIHDPGQAGLMRRFGQNIFLAGEVYIYGNEEDDGDQTWEMYSTLN